MTKDEFKTGVNFRHIKGTKQFSIGPSDIANADFTIFDENGFFCYAVLFHNPAEIVFFAKEETITKTAIKWTEQVPMQDLIKI